MIKDKNVFECFIVDNTVCLPHYIYYSPPSIGYHRRSVLFKKHFPKYSIVLLDKYETGKARKNWSTRKLFEYKEEANTLHEVPKGSLYPNSFGYVVRVGDRFEQKGQVYTIRKLEVKRYAGLIATYTTSIGDKQTNISSYNWDTDKSCWTYGS